MATDLCDGPSRVVGTKQLVKQLIANSISVLYLASDAQDHIKDKLLALAGENNVPVIEVESMVVLGRMCGIAVGSAAAGLLKEAV